MEILAAAYGAIVVFGLMFVADTNYIERFTNFIKKFG